MGAAALGAAGLEADVFAGQGPKAMAPLKDSVRLFLCGDVMTGRGIDQVLPHPGGDRLYEPVIRSARGYVRLAEDAHGPIPRPVDYAYVWGDALEELERMKPRARIVNLETAVTAHDRPWPGKGIHYRMHPANVPCLTAAGIDCVALANNHVLDWEREGLQETLAILKDAGIRTAGAGADAGEAAAPAVLDLGSGRRILVFAFGVESSGIAADWAATASRSGVNLLPGLSYRTLGDVATAIRSGRRVGDIVVASIHWGPNWGYQIPGEHVAFAHGLIEEAGVDVVHGHSSHHPLGIEVHQDRPILYGCGDFLNDYEGIGGHEQYRPDLSLGYFVEMDPASGKLAAIIMAPFRMRRFRLERANAEDTRWLGEVMDREGQKFGTGATLDAEGRLRLGWSKLA
jgi:poly-gamma-glutamate synthesis protein (capsule biosynthesis protein)